MKIVKGDVTSINEGIIVHGCNSIGVMGAGIAGQIKLAYPEAFVVYSRHHRNMGSITQVEVATNKFIVNGVTQKSVGQGKQISYDAIEEVFLRTFALQASLFDERGIMLPVCFPMIGAGLGGGNWNIIRTIIEENTPEKVETFLYVLR